MDILTIMDFTLILMGVATAVFIVMWLVLFAFAFCVMLVKCFMEDF